MTRVHTTLSHCLTSLAFCSSLERGRGERTGCLADYTVHGNSDPPSPPPLGGWMDTLVHKVELSLGPGDCRLDTKFRVR